jgi:predicted methyltransferase
MTSVSFPLIPNEPEVQFRFTIRTARELDRASSVGIQKLLQNGQTTDAMVLMTCYGLRHLDHKMTEQKAEELIQQYVDTGGDAKALFIALFDALNKSGVFGKPDGEANPTQATQTMNHAMV